MQRKKKEYHRIMDRLSTLLPKALRKRGLKDQADASLVVHRAQTWLREKELENASAEKLDNGALFIEVDSSIAAQECHAQKEELLSFLQKSFPDIAVNRVRIIRKQLRQS